MSKFNEIVRLIENDPGKANEALSKEALRLRNSVGETLLHFFAIEREIEIVKLILGKGAEIDALDTCHRSPLMYASMLGYPEIVQLLLRHGADPNLQAHGENALRNALSSQRYEVADILIEAGANVNQCDPTGETMLFEAVRTEDTKMIQYLLQNGAKKEIKNMFKDTVSDIALERENYAIAEMLKKSKSSSRSA